MEGQGRANPGARTDRGSLPAVSHVAADEVIDELPPGITSMSADLSVAAFDSVLWCAR
jgi:hypothetical protein